MKGPVWLAGNVLRDQLKSSNYFMSEQYEIITFIL